MARFIYFKTILVALRTKLLCLLNGWVCRIWCHNQDKSAAIFCHQVAVWVPVMFCNFYLVKNHKVGNNSETNDAREKVSADLKSL